MSRRYWLTGVASVVDELCGMAIFIATSQRGNALGLDCKEATTALQSTASRSQAYLLHSTSLSSITMSDVSTRRECRILGQQDTEVQLDPRQGKPSSWM